MSKKILAMLLVLVMALSVLVSCKEDEKVTESTTGEANEGEGEFAEIDNYVSDLASQYSFDGATFNIIGSPATIYPENPEVTGNLENDALYSRVVDIEENFGIQVTFRVSKGPDAGYENTGMETTDVVTTDQMSGLRSYDLVERVIWELQVLPCLTLAASSP